jgi:outer membrane receptor protein involved in Fe transport
MRQISYFTSGFAFVATVATPVHAGEWKHEVAPYVWGAGMSGKSGVGDVVADVEMSFGDIVENLQYGFMGAYRASNDQWSITVDGVYMALGATERGPHGRLKADIDLDQAALEVDAGYAVLDQLTLIAGLRYNDITAKVRAAGPLGNVEHASGSKSWVDPVLGASYRIPFNDTWSLMLRGDIGGFGVGSDFAWQGAATLRWQAKPTFGVLAAYRYIDMDYDSDSGARTFKYDMAMSGPALGVVFSF